MSDPPAAAPQPPDDMERRRQLVGELVLRLMLVRRAPVTFLLLAMMGGLYAIALALGGATDPVGLATLGAKVNPLIERGEVWRLVSSIFVHVGAIHLVGNGLLLFFLGRLVENALGPRWFLVIFVLSGVGGAIASFLTSPLSSAGASGAVAGLMGAAIFSGIKHRKTIPDRLLRQLALVLLPCLLLALAYGFMGEHVDNAAHVGGLLVGSLGGMLAHSPLLAGKGDPATTAAAAAAGSPTAQGLAWTTIPLNLVLGACLGLLLYGALGTLASLFHALGGT